MNITKDFISAVAPNAEAAKNGAELAKKKNFSNLTIDSEDTYIGGACKGSGSKPYNCSADFINAESPVFRCSCPSRQIPCKHVLGLLWAYCEGELFQTGLIPPDILEKREKSEKRAAKKEEAAQVVEKVETPSSPAKTAAKQKTAVKKIEAQITGLHEAAKIIQNMTRTGLGAIDVQSLKNFGAAVKQLDSYYISGIQDELNDLLGMLDHRTAAEDKKGFGSAVEQITRIHILLNRCETYLTKKKEDPFAMDTQSEIEELMGYPWKLQELSDCRLYEQNAELLQMGFHVRDETDKRRFVDEGFFISLNSGKIYKTKNYRPYKAVKYIREDDSVFALLQIPKLYVYPSLSLNPRVRWDSCDYIAAAPDSYTRVKTYGSSDFTEIVKNVKNQLKDIILSRNPVVLVRFSALYNWQENNYTRPHGRAEAEGFDQPRWAITDAKGNRLTLKAGKYCNIDFMELLHGLTPNETKDQCMALLFENDIENGELFAQPIALVTDERLLRLIY